MLLAVITGNFFRIKRTNMFSLFQTELDLLEFQDNRNIKNIKK